MDYSIYKNKNVLVTGASGGIGAALAQKFAEQGCRLFLTGRKESEIKRLIKRISQSAGVSGDVFYELVDLKSLKDLERLVLSVRKKMGTVDILINCAGAFYQKTLTQSTVKDFEDCFDLNVRPMFFLTKEFSKDMVKKWGRIINIGSVSSYSGYKGTSLYCASKHAVLGFSRACQEELKGHNVRVVCASPGSTKTKMGRITKNQDFNTFIDPAEFAEYVLFSSAFDGMMISKEIKLERMYVQ
jgi:short-subunit dehydrogenase